MKKGLRKIAAAVLAVCAAFALWGCDGGGAGVGAGKTPDPVPEGWTEEGAADGGALFGEPENALIYNYCPTAFYEDENTLRVWYCSNRDNGDITDYIAYREGRKLNGKWYWSPKELVLSPTPDTWDSRHTCDPSVVKGEFGYKGETYAYLMAYLGCVTSNSMRNETGLAVANAPGGPWVKVAESNPIVAVPDDLRTWGYGQPSLVSADKKGTVLLFYTAGEPSGTSGKVEKWDFSDLDAPEMLFRYTLANTGLKQLDMRAADHISNADFAYDPVSARFYMIDDVKPTDRENAPSMVSSAVRAAYFNATMPETEFGRGLGEGAGAWRYAGVTDAERTGFSRNHNACFVTDPYGWLPTGDKVELFYTTALLNYPMNSLWTYRIRRASVDRAI
ncbi:MAG: hypothetical protein LBL66_08700 [Clostridiales bacterium]|nr:hypothetical protein [Clostridiales bacterium]